MSTCVGYMRLWRVDSQSGTILPILFQCIAFQYHSSHILSLCEPAFLSAALIIGSSNIPWGIKRIRRSKSSLSYKILGSSMVMAERQSAVMETQMHHILRQYCPWEQGPWDQHGAHLGPTGTLLSGVFFLVRHDEIKIGYYDKIKHILIQM